MSTEKAVDVVIEAVDSYGQRMYEIVEFLKISEEVFGKDFAKQLLNTGK